MSPSASPRGPVTANLFSVLGVTPIRGRVSRRRRTSRTVRRSSILGYGLWQRRYGGDPSMVGRTIQINGAPYEVVGIMPRRLRAADRLPESRAQRALDAERLDPRGTDHGSHGYYAAGRLKPGATVAQAREELHGIAQGMTRARALSRRRCSSTPSSCRSATRSSARVRRAIWLLFGAVGFLLLIACANVANLLLARAEARQREMAVRTALGAGAARVVRQLLTESLVLAGVSAAAGLALAWSACACSPGGTRRASRASAGTSVDWRVLLFTVGVALVTTRDLQPGAGRPRLLEVRPDRVDEGRRRQRDDRRRAAPALPQRARRRRDGARRRPARRRRPDARGRCGRCSASISDSTRRAC